MVVIITAGIALSVGSVMALAAIVAAKTLSAGYPLVVGIGPRYPAAIQPCLDRITDRPDLGIPHRKKIAPGYAPVTSVLTEDADGVESSVTKENRMDIHKNAPLTPLGRADLVRRMVEDGQIPKAVAAAFGVSVAPRWSEPPGEGRRA